MLNEDIHSGHRASVFTVMLLLVSNTVNKNDEIMIIMCKFG